jgi:G3E family GTPase
VNVAMLDLFPSREAGLFGRRLKRERGARIPVTVVTGFLGAGKTTLIRRFLESPEGQGTAVIVNEFGVVGIDDALVRDSAEQTVLLGNGCVCCITRSDLQLALRQLLIDRERGLAPGFARIVIETSGLADPAPILQTFSTDRALGGEFHIDVLLAVVDAMNGEANLKTAAEARKQVILADRLVISKSDLAGAAEVELLIRHLQELNPRAAIDVAVAGALDPDQFIAPATAERSGFIAEAEHSDGIASFVLERQKPMRWPAFTRAMETLIALRGGDLLRVKGILNVAGCQGPVIVQYVQHLAHPPVELQSWPDQNRNSRIVFITRKIAETQVRDLFAAVETLANSV